jgi:hypothetical protein
MINRIPSKSLRDVATILEEELDSMKTEWNRLVALVPTLTTIPLSDRDRASHLSRLFDDVLCRLRGDRHIKPSVSIAASAHGRIRFAQGYSAAMLVEESRIFEVTTFGTLQRHQHELDQNHLLQAVMIIADEADRHLEKAVVGFMTARAAA